MPNPDPTTFQPPPPLIKSENFTDPLQPGSTWTFRFRAFPDLSQDKKIQDKASEYIEKYVSTLDGSLPAKLPPLGEGENRREVILCVEIVQAVAGLEVMQFPEDEADRWNFFQWCYFYLIAPNAFQAASIFAFEVQAEAREGKKNLLSPDTESPSDPSSTIASSTRSFTISSLHTSEAEQIYSERLQELAVLETN